MVRGLNMQNAYSKHCAVPNSSTYSFIQAQQSNRVCNALALLQCVASHPETRSAFLNGQCKAIIMTVPRYHAIITSVSCQLTFRSFSILSCTL